LALEKVETGFVRIISKDVSLSNLRNATQSAFKLARDENLGFVFLGHSQEHVLSPQHLTFKVHLCVGSRRRNNPKDLRYRLFLGWECQPKGRAKGCVDEEFINSSSRSFDDWAG